jgi:hypothetical protein
MIIQEPNILLVTYDLKTPGKNYSPLYEALKTQGKWWHYLTSTWLLSTTKPPQQVFADLSPHLTSQDYLLIFTVGKPYWGTLPKEAWDWIKEQGVQPF